MTNLDTYHGRAVAEARERRQRLYNGGRASEELEVLSPPAMRRRRVAEATRRQPEARQLVRTIPTIPVIPTIPTIPVILEEEPELLPVRPLIWIMRDVAADHGLKVNDIRSAVRNKRVCAARHEYFYRAASETLASYVKIGRVCGDMDHTSVIHGIRRHCQHNGISPLPRGMKP